MHAAQGRTVEVAHALVDGLGHRQWLYVAMSRGRQSNYAYCVTGYPQLADPRQGSRPAPELTTARALAHEAAGLRPTPGQTAQPGPDADEQHRDPQAVLADIVQRDGSVLSATETLRTELASADHLGILASIWYDITRRAQTSRYAAELRDTLSEPLADDVLTDPASTWLWRSLRHAEAAGLNSAEVLRQAVATRSLADARNVARVLDSRIRHMIAHLPPAAGPRWADQVPVTGDPDTDRFMTDLAGAMDDRTRRIGEHITETQPAWAVRALGPVPDDPAERAAWQQRAATIGAYREIYGHDSQTDAIGPQPALTAPEAWASWHTALAALDRIDGIDLRGLSDGQLTLRRATYQRELAWAPPYVAEELRLARLQARTARENTTRATHAARAAADPQTAARHRDLARIWDAMHTRATSVAGTLATAQQTRRQWAALTDSTRRMALAADLELRRRHPDAKLPPLVPPAGAASPEFTTSPVGEERIAPRDPGTPKLIDLTTAEISPQTQQRLTAITEAARRAQQQIDYLASMPRYAADDHSIYLGTAWETLARRQRDAIIQPPKPEITPAAAVVQRSHQQMAQAEPEMEAGW